MTRPGIESEPIEPSPAPEKPRLTVELDDIREVLGIDRLAWPPERAETPEAAHEATAGYKDLKEGILATTEGPTPEFADAAACEEMMWARRCLLESQNGETAEERRALEAEAQESIEKARKLLAFAEGDGSQAGFVEQEWKEERELLDGTLNRLEEERFSPRVVSEMFVYDENDRESIERVTLKYKKLSALRGPRARPVTTRPTPGEAAPPTPEPATTAENMNEVGTATETARGDFEPVPTDRRELIRYERRNFAEFDPSKLEQFRAYLEVRLQESIRKAAGARRSGQEVRFADTVAAVLGNGGEAPLFLGRAINRQLPPDERLDDMRELLQMPFSKAAEYLGIDVRKEHPDYYETFSPRDESVGAPA